MENKKKGNSMKRNKNSLVKRLSALVMCFALCVQFANPYMVMAAEISETNGVGQNDTTAPKVLGMTVNVDNKEVVDGITYWGTVTRSDTIDFVIEEESDFTIQYYIEKGEWVDGEWKKDKIDIYEGAKKYSPNASGKYTYNIVPTKLNKAGSGNYKIYAKIIDAEGNFTVASDDSCNFSILKTDVNVSIEGNARKGVDDVWYTIDGGSKKEIEIADCGGNFCVNYVDVKDEVEFYFDATGLKVEDVKNIKYDDVKDCYVIPKKSLLDGERTVSILVDYLTEFGISYKKGEYEDIPKVNKKLCTFEKDGNVLVINWNSEYYARISGNRNYTVTKDKKKSIIKLNNNGSGTINVSMIKDEEAPVVSSIVSICKDKDDSLYKVSSKKADDYSSDNIHYICYSGSSIGTVRITAKDASTGVGIYRCVVSYVNDINKGEEVKETGGYFQFEKDISKGTKTAYVWIEDYCGNKIKLVIDITRDDEAPVFKSYKLTNEFEHYYMRADYEQWKRSKKYSIDIVADETQGSINVVWHIYDKNRKEVFTGKSQRITKLSSDTYRSTVSGTEINELKNGKYTVDLTLEDDTKNSAVVKDAFSFKFEDSKCEFESIDTGSGMLWVKPGAGWTENDMVKAKVKSYCMLDKISYAITTTKEAPTKWENLDTSSVATEDGTVAEITYNIPYWEHTKEGVYNYYFWVKDYNGEVVAKKTLTYYVDGESPEVSDFEYSSKNSGLKRMFKFLFGSFFKSEEEVTFSVKAKDTYDVDSVKLYYMLYDGNDNEEYTDADSLYQKLENENAKVVDMNLTKDDTYSCDVNLPSESRFYKIYIVAQDKAGNKTIKNLKSLSGKSSLIMVDDEKPVIDISVNTYGKKGYVEKCEDETKVWYPKKSKIVYDLNISDAESGIFSVDAGINGEKLDSDIQGKAFHKTTDEDVSRVTNLTYNIGITQGSISKSGEYGIEVNVEDNAGNTYSAGKNVYVDEDAPVITDAYIDSDEKMQDVVPMQYGYYYKKATKIKVYATDYIGKTEEIGSGVKTITCVYNPEDNSKKKVVTLPAVKVEGEDATYCATFSVPKGYKGQFKFYATDNVNQKSKSFNPKGAIIESLREHKANSKVSIELPETQYKDANGNKLYDDDIKARFHVEDIRSGISKINWKFKEYYQEDATNAESLLIGSVYNTRKEKWVTVTDNGSGWKFGKMLDVNLVTSASKSQIIKGNSNNMKISLGMVDNIGYKSAITSEIFSIDKTAPVIDVVFDGEAQNEKYYKSTRVATVTITDANFSPELVEFITTGPNPRISKWEHVAGDNCNGKIHTGKCSYTCKVYFEEDGDYTFSLKCQDLAGHETVYGKTEEFTIDKTSPVVEVTYSDNSPMNGNYYNSTRTATITVKDENFDSSRTDVIITAKDSKGVPGNSGFKRNGDVWTSTVSFSQDGVYKIDVTCTDMAGNEGNKYEGESFVIDTTDPEIKVSGVEDNSANNGRVAPCIRVEDTNIDANKVTVDIQGANNGKVDLPHSRSNSTNVVSINFLNIKKEKAMDDLYTLKIDVIDKAGNKSVKKIIFSVNRFGSVYVLGDKTKELVDKFYTNEEVSLEVTEINVDVLQESTIDCSIDGTTTTLEKGKDYSVLTGTKNGKWKTYKYTIGKHNFEEEGNYVISFFSKDKATNESSNRSKDIDISFVIDKTPPTIVMSGVEDGKQYVEGQKNLVVDVEDNILLEEVNIYNNDKVCVSKDRDELLDNNGELSTQLESSHDNQVVYVKATDIAGNVTVSKKVNFLLTTNLLVQWYSNVTYVSSTFLGFGGIVTAVYFIGNRKRRRKN